MTIATIRPTTDAKRTGVSLVGGATVAAVSSDDVDGNFAYVVNSQQYPNGYALVNMADFTVPANSRVKQCRLRSRIRMHDSDPGHAPYLEAVFRSSVTGNQGGNTIFSTASFGTTFEKTGAWATKHPNGVEWSQPGIANIQVALGWHYSIGSSHVNITLTELYADIDYRAQPTVSGVTVTGNDISTRPTVTWTYNPNADFDAQFWYQVKIFSAAQIAAFGFSAETSRPVWASGEIAGDAETQIVDQDLSLGVTYTAYVKAAQKFNGLPWYSNYATSSTFSITPVVPPAPVLALSADATVPYLRNKLTATQNINMLTEQQASLEDGTTTGWAVGTACTIAPQTPIAADGAYSLAVTSTSASTMRAETTPGLSGIPVNSSTQYTAIAYVRTASVVKSTFVSIRWYDKDGTFISQDNGSASNDTTSFVIRTATFVSPATARYAAVSVTWTTPTGGGEVHYLDRVDLHIGSGATWTPAGASTVIEAAWVTTSEGNLIHPQLFTGGEYEETAAGFSTFGTRSTVAYDTSDQFHGIGSIRWNVDDANTTTKLYIGWPSGTEVNPAPIYPMAAVPGRPYSFSLRAKASASFSSQLNLTALDKDGGALSTLQGGSITITTSWVEYKLQNFTMPANTVWIKAVLDNTAAVTDKDVWVDACRWYQATTVPSSLEQSTSGLPTIWMPVRGANVADLPAVTGDGKVYVHDLEVPCGYSVVYRARNYSPADSVSGLPALSSDPTAYIMTMMDNPGVWVLSLPGNGRLRAQVRITDFAQSRHEESETFFPLRPGGYSFPVVVSDFMGGRDGSITIKTKTEEEWRQLESLVQLQQTLWLVHPDFGARYIRIVERSWEIVQLDRNMTWLRKVSLPFLEVDRPAV